MKREIIRIENCPLCSSEADYKYPSKNTISVFCKKCGINLTKKHLKISREELLGLMLEIWNTRKEKKEFDCRWLFDGEVHNTSCGNEFVFVDEGIQENKFEFCPYCGGKIKEGKEK